VGRVRPYSLGRAPCSPAADATDNQPNSVMGRIARLGCRRRCDEDEKENPEIHVQFSRCTRALRRKAAGRSPFGVVASRSSPIIQAFDRSPTPAVGRVRHPPARAL